MHNCSFADGVQTSIDTRSDALCVSSIGNLHWLYMQDDRPTRAVVLKDKSVVMLYNVDGEVYCSDANSTAFKFPLTHAKIVKGKQQDLHD